jgi:ferrous iron transport protein B
VPSELGWNRSGLPELGVGAGSVAGDPRRPWLERITAHRAGGPLVFFAVIWVAFKLTTDIAAPFIEWIDVVVNGPLHRRLAGMVTAIGLGGSWFESLIVDGILAGVGTVLAFIPVLVSLYLVLATLEESGYLARGAASVEGAARLIDLPGSALLPISLGFGCTVPGLLALRAVESPRDRVLAGLLVPFMACAARLPVFVLMATAFFVERRTLVVFSMYLLGVVVAAVIGVLLGTSVLRSDREPVPGSTALPPLRTPRAGVVMKRVRSQTVSFVRGAGTVVLGASVAIWMLLAIPVGGTGTFAATPVDQSAYAAVSRTLAPAMEPLGLGDWHQTGALLSGLIAKEVTISALVQGYAVDDPPDDDPTVGDDLHTIGVGFLSAARRALWAIPGVVGIDLSGGEPDQDPKAIGVIRGGFEASSDGQGAAAALAFMVFVLLYTPCVVSLATTKRELGLRWMWVSAVGQLLVAWLVAFGAFRLAGVIGVG